MEPVSVRLSSEGNRKDSKQNKGFLSSRLLSRNVKAKIHKIIILPVVLYGCETWSLKLREEHRLRVFENRVLRRMGEWRKLHNEELHNLYSSPDIIRQIKSRRMRWAGHVARMREERKLQDFGGKPRKERDHLEDQGVGGRMESEWILDRVAWGGGWIGFDWLMIGTGGRLL
jgi:hypothetical protein